MKTTMANFVQWLHHRQKTNICLVLLFFLLVVLPHEQVGLFIVHIFKDYSRDTYNLVILIMGLVGLAAYFVPLIKYIYRGKHRKLKIFYTVSTLIFVIIAFNLLVIVNVEIIHFLQYGLMALLVFPLTLRYGETLYWCTLLGAIDEAYQYFYLAPHRTEYYDFNDVIINLLGAALGLILLRIMDIGQIGVQRKKWIKTAPAIVTILLSGVVFILWKVGILFVYPPAGGLNEGFLLVKKVPPGFWSIIHPNVTYHVIQPLEGIILLTIFFAFYAGLGKKTLI